MPQSQPFTTRDGRQVTIRRIEAGDAPLLVDLFHHLSDETKRLRFHIQPRNLSSERIWQTAERLSRLDPTREVALGALIVQPTTEETEQLVGVARFGRQAAEDAQAEAAVVVRDDFQAVGLGTHLLTKLSQIAYQMGIVTFTAWVRSENRAALSLLKKSGLPYRQHTSQGDTEVFIDITPIAAGPDPKEESSGDGPEL